MLNKVAKGISYAFHPVFIPTYLVLSLKFLAPLPVFYIFFNARLFTALLFLVVVYTAIVPMVFVYLQYRMKFVKDITLSEQSDRPKVYLFTSGFFVALAYFLNAKGAVFMPTAVIIASMAVCIICLFLITFFDKISAHSAGISGVLGVYVAIFQRYGDSSLIFVSLSIFILFGIIATCRLFLGAHNLRQVIMGGILGFTVCFLGVCYFMKL